MMKKSGSPTCRVCITANLHLDQMARESRSQGTGAAERCFHACAALIDASRPMNQILEECKWRNLPSPMGIAG